MSFPDEIQTQPPGDWNFALELYQATASGPDAGIAYADAVALLPGFDPAFLADAELTASAGAKTAGGTCLIGVSIGTFTIYTATVQRYRAVLGWYAATCFFRLEWDEVTRELAVDGATGIETLLSTSTSAQTFSMPITISNSGLCIPLDLFSANRWNVSGIVAGPTTVPFPSGSLPPADGSSIRREIGVANVRWSWVNGYVPPTDGSANGFTR